MILFSKVLKFFLLLVVYPFMWASLVFGFAADGLISLVEYLEE